MLKNVVVSFILICLIFVISFAGVSYELEGWVKYQNKKPASGVSMSIGKYYIVTDQNGYYKFTLLKPGEHFISISPPERSIRPVKVIIKENYPYQIDNDLNILNIWNIEGGKILRYTGRDWEQLDDNPDNYGILFHNNILYKILRNGEIWQYTLIRGWNKLDHDPTTCAFFTNFIPKSNSNIVRKDFLIDW